MISQALSDTFLDHYAPCIPTPDSPEITAHQAPEIFDLWEAWEALSGGICEIPFWAILWPGARVLAAHILDNKELVRGKRVLDLGCGSGIIGIASALAGAGRVVCNDIDCVALAIARKNAAASGVIDRAIDYVSRDMTKDSVSEEFDLVFVADMFYSKSTSDPFVPLLTRLRTAGARIIFGDGSRAFAPTADRIPIVNVSVPVSRVVEGVDCRDVAVFEWLAVS